MLIINRGILLEGLTKLSYMLDGKSKVEEERSVVIEHTGNKLCMFVQSKEGSLILDVPIVEVQEQTFSSACINMPKFMNAVRLTGVTDVKLYCPNKTERVKKPSIAMEAGKAKTIFKGMLGPKAHSNAWSPQNATSVDSSMFCELIARVLKAVAGKITTKQVSAYVALKGHGDYISVAATNTAIAMYTTLAVGKPIEWERLHVKARPIRAIERICGASKEGFELHISVSDTMIKFKGDDFVAAVPLGKVTAPPYETIVNTTPPMQLKVQKEDLLKSLLLMDSQADGSHRIANLTIKKRSVTLSTASSTAAGRRTIDAKLIGENVPSEIRMSLNPSLVLIGLSIVSSDEVLLQLTGPLKPLKIIEGPTTFVILPMRPIERRLGGETY